MEKFVFLKSGCFGARRCCCVFVNRKIKFSQSDDFASLASLRCEMKGGEVSEGKIIQQQQKNKLKEYNGKSNFCITKHFTLCVLQAWKIAWVVGRGNAAFVAPGPSE